MAGFALNIEAYYRLKQQEGKTVKAFALIQYPVLCIHATILEKESNTFEYFDECMADLLYKIGPLREDQITAYFSLSATIIHARVNNMLGNQRVSIKDDRLHLEQNGIDVFIEKTQVNLQKKNIDFYLDGISHTPLSQHFYKQGRGQLISQYDIFTYTDENGETRSWSPFSPDVIPSPPALEFVENRLLSIPEDKRKDYHIPVGIQKVTSIPFTQMSYPILIAILQDQTGSITKEAADVCSSVGDSTAINAFTPYYKDRMKYVFIKLDTYEAGDDTNNSSRYTFSSNWMKMETSEQIEQTVFQVSKTDFKLMLQIEYGLEVTEEQLICNEHTLGVTLRKKDIQNLPDKLKLINNLARKRDYVNGSRTRGAWKIFVEFQSDCPELLEIEKLQRAIKKNRRIEVSELIDNFPDINKLRDHLMFLEQYGIREKVDMYRFMKPTETLSGK